VSNVLDGVKKAWDWLSEAVGYTDSGESDFARARREREADANAEAEASAQADAAPLPRGLRPALRVIQGGKAPTSPKRLPAIGDERLSGPRLVSTPARGAPRGRGTSRRARG
jgi:hypothetical protein